MFATSVLTRWTAEGKQAVQETLDRIKALSRRLTSGGIRRIKVSAQHFERLGREMDRIAAPVLRRFGLLGPAPRLARARVR